MAIGEHLLASKYEEYPYGWFKDGRMSNHNNYDVVKILRLIWKDLPDALQDKFRGEIENMTIWALRSSLRRDGSVDFYPAMFEFSSAEYYYLVSFLEQIGYWKKINNSGSTAIFPKSRMRIMHLSICSWIKRSFDSRRFQDGPALATRRSLPAPAPTNSKRAQSRQSALIILSSLRTSSCHCALAAIQRGPWQTVVQFKKPASAT